MSGGVLKILTACRKLQISIARCQKVSDYIAILCHDIIMFVLFIAFFDLIHRLLFVIILTIIMMLMLFFARNLASHIADLVGQLWPLLCSNYGVLMSEMGNVSAFDQNHPQHFLKLLFGCSDPL